MAPGRLLPFNQVWGFYEGLIRTVQRNRTGLPFFCLLESSGCIVSGERRTRTTIKMACSDQGKCFLWQSR